MKIRSVRESAWRAATGFALLGAAVCLAACANIWGFQDLKEGDAAVDDTGGDGAIPVAEGGETRDAVARADTGTVDDASLVEDVKGGMDASPIHDAAREGSTVLPDGSGVTDAAAFMKCMPNCGGCCDPGGTCITMTQQSTTVCGSGGSACVDCTQMTCPFASTPCCGKTSGACGCASAGVLCDKN